MKDGAAFCSIGKMLGGSSGIGAMLYLRGNKRDYDQWAANGNRDWNWDNVLEYFKKSEDNHVESLANDTRYHGRGGPLKVNFFNSDVPIRKVLFEAVSELGYYLVDDLNAGQNLGFATIEGTVDNGTRCSSAKAFLIPAKSRNNLYIVKRAHVTELNFNSAGSVTGVKFQLAGRAITVYSEKEVILSAGAINTPQILMLSGIGTAEELSKYDIPVRQELPVGMNLQDHVYIQFAMTFNKSNSQPLQYIDYAGAWNQYNSYRNGTLSTVGVKDFAGFVSTVNDPSYPDIQYEVSYFYKQHPTLRAALLNLNYNDDTIESFVNANNAAEMVIWGVSLLHPKSRGRVALRSTDPFDKPKIYPNYLTEDEDAETLIRGIKILQNITSTTAFLSNKGELVELNVPGCRSFSYGTDDYWRCYVHYMSVSNYHVVGTARMGPASDVNAVVSDRLKVKGVTGLRVVDASIMPEIVGANTNAATMMIAEMGADFIKQDWTSKTADSSRRQDQLSINNIVKAITNIIPGTKS